MVRPRRCSRMSSLYGAGLLYVPHGECLFYPEIHKDLAPSYYVGHYGFLSLAHGIELQQRFA